MIFFNAPLFAVCCLTLLFCACEKDDMSSSLTTEAPLDVVELSRLLPGSRWQLASLVPAEGDMEINVAWKGTTVEFTADSAFFYRKHLVFDLISQTKSTENTLAAWQIFGLYGGKYTRLSPFHDAANSFASQ